MPAPRTYAALGTRRHRVLVENPGAATPNGDGTYTIAAVVSPIPWHVALDVSDSATRAKSLDQESAAGATLTAHIHHTAIGDYRPDVTTRSTLLFNGRRLAVVAVQNMDERNITTLASCTE